MVTSRRSKHIRDYERKNNILPGSLETDRILRLYLDKQKISTTTPKEMQKMYNQIRCSQIIPNTELLLSLLKTSDQTNHTYRNSVQSKNIPGSKRRDRKSIWSSFRRR